MRRCDAGVRKDARKEPMCLPTKSQSQNQQDLALEVAYAECTQICRKILVTLMEMTFNQTNITKLYKLCQPKERCAKESSLLRCSGGVWQARCYVKWRTWCGRTPDSRYISVHFTNRTSPVTSWTLSPSRHKKTSHHEFLIALTSRYKLRLSRMWVSDFLLRLPHHLFTLSKNDKPFRCATSSTAACHGTNHIYWQVSWPSSSI